MPASSTRVVALAAVLLSGACARPAAPDAYGNVEATEVVVGAEAAGRLTSYTVSEGQRIGAGDDVGAIDAAQLGFEREQVVAQRGATASRIDEVRQQVAVFDAQRSAAAAQRDSAKAQRLALDAQHQIAARTRERTARLFAEQAATAQRVDAAERDEQTLSAQLRAQDEQITALDRQAAALGRQIAAAHAQEQTIAKQVAAADAQVSQAGERIRKANIRNPVAGTVLTSYVKAGEIVQVGQPLYRIADLSSVDVRAYVAETQLARVRVGANALVSVDTGRNQRESVSGIVSWIAAQAEFTPTPIQTREERAGLVYAVKIHVPNDRGLFKIGMPVDVQFTGNQASR